MKKNITSLFHAKNLALPLLLCLPMFGSNETKEIENMNEKVWNQFSQVGNIYLNSPTVSKCYLSSDTKEGVGATRHMEMSLKKGAILENVF